MMERKLLKELKEWSKPIGIALFVVMLFNMYVVQVYQVSGSSMMPRLHENQYVVIYKLDRSFDYQDIVAMDPRLTVKLSVVDSFLHTPFLAGLTEDYWVKRVIGRPHDRIEFREGKLFRNGKQLIEPYLKESMKVPDAFFVVPEDHLFLMGDNRNHSLDSRSIGAVPLTHIVGKVIFPYE